MISQSGHNAIAHPGCPVVAQSPRPNDAEAFDDRRGAPKMPPGKFHLVARFFAPRRCVREHPAMTSAAQRKGGQLGDTGVGDTRGRRSTISGSDGVRSNFGWAEGRLWCYFTKNIAETLGTRFQAAAFTARSQGDRGRDKKHKEGIAPCGSRYSSSRVELPLV